jgi:hypothetical protein
VTGWSRIAYFDRIFPDAVFIFLRREARSVVSSWAQAGWLDVTSGLDSDKWQWGEVPAQYHKLWEGLGGGPVLSAAVKIQLDLDDIVKNIAQFQDRCYTVQYEDLISQPQKNLRAIIDFCHLDWYEEFQDQISAMEFYNPGNKWKKYLSQQQGDLILEFFKHTENQQWIANQSGVLLHTEKASKADQYRS